MKRTLITCVATLGLAANAYAKSSDTIGALRELIKDISHAEISQTATADVAAGVSRNFNRVRVAVSNDASSAGQAVSNAAVKAGQAVSNAATTASDAVSNAATKAGQYTMDETLRPTYDVLLVPTGNGVMVAVDWIAHKLPAHISAGVGAVVATLEFSGTATKDAAVATGRAIKADATAVSNAEISQTATVDVINGTVESQTVASASQGSQASKAFTSAPVDTISAAKKDRVNKAAKSTRARVEFYGRDSEKAAAEMISLGVYAAAQAGFAVTEEEALMIGAIYTFGLRGEI